MEPLNITHIEIDDNPDLGELYLLINSVEPKPAVSWLMDDQRNFYFRVDPETGKVVGAMVLFANDWFAEIAQAFQRHDVNHPEVRFFLQQLVNVLAQRLTAEPPIPPHPDTTELVPTLPEPWRVAPVDEPAPAINKIVETQPA
jgi:hypothetical protein